MSRVWVGIVSFLLLLIAGVPVYAQGVPSLPHAFYGTVTINNEPAPGTEISARGDGVIYPALQNPIITSVEGSYGIDSLKLLVQGDILDGTLITFYVNGVSTNQTWGWHSGDTTRLDLNITLPVYQLTVSSTTGGSVTEPGEGTFTTYPAGTVVDLLAVPQSGYKFVNWTGNVGTVANVNAADTTITMNGTYSITANFALITPPPSDGPPTGGVGGRDNTAPVISNIGLGPEGITETTAEICWTTNEASTSQTEYWYIICSQESTHAFSPVTETYTKDHCVVLTGLIPGTTYHYRVISKDASGNKKVSGEYTFTTLGKAPGKYTVSQLKISPAEVYIGEEVTISVLVTNDSNLATYTASLKIKGAVEDTQSVEIACTSKTITFTTSKTEPGTYSVNVNGLSGSFMVMAAPPAPAAFTVSSLSISPEEVLVSEQVTISILVKNIGDLTGSYTLSLKINDSLEATKEVSIGPGASEKVTFTTSKTEPGTYSVNVNGLSGSFMVMAAPAPAAFTVSSLTMSPPEVVVGEQVTIGVLVSNIGGVSGSYEVSLKINGALEATKKVTLSPGTSEKVTFTTTKDKPGTYSVDVNGLTDSFIVKKEPINWWVIGGIIGGVIVLGLLIYFFLVRRRET
ncbi:CARDB domain-containing protein [Chloroflexota bacterium]